MLTDNETEQLHSQNKLLRLQLQEAEEILAIREEELAMLRKQSKEAIALQSELNNSLHGMHQMQQFIGKAELKSEATTKLLEAAEEELFTSVKEQLQYAEALKNMQSVEADLADTNQELQEAAKLYKQVALLKAMLAEASSNLEIAHQAIGKLEEEVTELKALNQYLLLKSTKGA